VKNLGIIKIKAKNYSKSCIIIIGFCFFISFLFLLIATKSSPLYPFNDWVDTNASFTMGKAMMNGRVLYRDIFDQRGPLLYFLFGLAYLISKTSFLGVFIFEVLSFSVFLFFSYKLLILYLDIEYAIITLPVLAAVVLNLKSFSHGGSPEEFCLPLVVISLYYLLNYFRNIHPKPMPLRQVFLNGIIAGCVLWIKFSLLGFWFGWMVSIFIIIIIKHGLLRALEAALVFIFGMFTATLPWLLYFGINHSIVEWINSYLIINLTSYSDYSQGSSLIPNIKYIPIKFFGHLLLNPIIVGHLYLGFFVFLTNKIFISGFLKKLSILLCFLLLSISVFGFGQSHTYYFLIFSPFLTFGFIVVLTLAYQKFGEINSVKLFSIIFIISFAIAFIYNFTFHHNSYLLKLEKTDFVQFEFASIINETDNATLLNYGALDSGFYTTTGITPDVRFFQKQNIPYSRFPIAVNEQNRYIKDRFVDYVVIINPISENNKIIEIPFLYQNYTLLETETQKYEDKHFIYLLYKEK